MNNFSFNADKNDKSISAVTVIVAAYNSAHKDRADFVCDGTDDQVEIQAAINALPSDGGIVKLLDGRFNISMSIKPAKGCELIGQGKSSILYLVDAPNSLLSADADKGQANIILSDASGFRPGMPITIVSSVYRIRPTFFSITPRFTSLRGTI